MTKYSTAIPTRALFSNGTGLTSLASIFNQSTPLTLESDLIITEKIDIGSLVLVVATKSRDSRMMLRTKAWREFDELFERLDNSGEIINDLDDERLSALRSRWSKRIRSLYEPNSGE
jgi:hypothetical protein